MPSSERQARPVETLLRDEEWGKWSNNKIARQCAVTDKTVARHRESIFGNSEDAPVPRKVSRGGTTYTQKTGKIGTTHETFETYCKERWGMGRTFAFYQIESARVVSLVHNCEHVPANEAQARPLTKLGTDDGKVALSGRSGYDARVSVSQAILEEIVALGYDVQVGRAGDRFLCIAIDPKTNERFAVAADDEYRAAVELAVMVGIDLEG